ncbi:hypothetical protein IAD21_00199 [Abditibacteriota bacterium]|nr:hypothetical protein IAD21_00199 [Abditibacteriota bacterium]
MVRTGLIFAVLSLAVLLYTRSFDWHPVNLRLNLLKDNTTTQTFKAGMNATCEIQVILRRQRPLRGKKAVREAINNPKPHFYNHLALPRLFCSIFNRGHEVAYKAPNKSEPKAKVFSVARRFPVVAGQTYTVKAVVKAGDSRFDTAAAYLEVVLFRDAIYRGRDSIMLTESVATIGLLLGLALVSGGVMKVRRRRAS